jgi:outer membrane protein OmpA-like peptidoglycan-associated protein
MSKAILMACAIGLAATLLPGAAAASDEREINSIIRSLAPIDRQTVVREPRRPDRLRVLVDGRAILLDTRYSAEFEVYFPFNSAQLTPRAQEQLHALGRALESGSLRPYSYLVMGHTDAKGSASYNRDLSLRRAVAVRAYLIRHFAIEPARLEAVGFGKDHLKVESEPYAAVNRRVEVTMIVPPGAGAATRDDDVSVTITID